MLSTALKTLWFTHKKRHGFQYNKKQNKKTKREKKWDMNSSLICLALICERFEIIETDFGAFVVAFNSANNIDIE